MASEQFLGNGTALIFDHQARIANSFAFGFALLGLLGISLILYSSLFFNHTPHQMLILSTCSADFIMCLYSVLSIGSNLHRGSWPGGQIGLSLCIFNNWAGVTTVITSVSSYSMIALERYYVIFHGLTGHEKKTKIAIITFWILAALLGIYSSNDLKNIQLFSSKIFCAPKPNSQGFYVIYPIFAISPSVMVYCYFSIYKFYTKKQADSRIQNEEGSVQNPKERQLLLKLVVITGSFFLFFIPFVILKFIEMASKVQATLPVDTIRFTLLLCNAVINPIILYTFDPQIKYQVDFIFHLDRCFEIASGKMTNISVKKASQVSGKKSSSNYPGPGNGEVQERDTVKMLLI